MILGYILCFFALISLPKLGRLLRIPFLEDQHSGWFVDAILGTVFFITALFVGGKLGVPMLWLAPILVPGWFLKLPKTSEIRTILVSLLVLFFGATSLFAHGFLIAENPDYANVFYNVDTPFTLMLGQSFQQSGSYPPLLLENEGMALRYHYGYPIFLAFLSSLGGIKVHVVHGLFLMPWLVFLLVGMLITFLMKWGKQKLFWAAFFALVIWLGYRQYLFNYLNPTTLKNLVTLTGRYSAVYHLGPSAFEPVILLAIFWFLKLKTHRAFVFATIFLVLIPLFKIPLGPLAGLGFAAAMLYYAWLLKKPVLLVYPMAGALGMYFIFKTFSASISVAPVIKFLQASHVHKDHWFSMVLPLMVLFGIHFFTGKKLLRKENIMLFAFILPLPVLLLLINIDDVNTWQLISGAPFTAWFMVVLLLVSSLPLLLPVYKKALFGLAVLALLLPLANAAYYINTLFVHPEIGHEFCDNQLLANTLKKIPVKGSVLATNDLRYPAENFLRDGNQFQFSALYGHQSKVSNMSYLITPEFLKYALHFQSKMPKNEPTETEYQFLKAEGVTHFVLALSDSTKTGNPVVAYKIYRVR